MKNFTINITDESMRKLNAVSSRKNMTIEEAVVEMFEHGLKDTCYRIQRNARVYQQKKEEAETLKRLEEKLKELGVNVDEL